MTANNITYQNVGETEKSEGSDPAPLCYPECAGEQEEESNPSPTSVVDHSRGDFRRRDHSRGLGKFILEASPVATNPSLQRIPHCNESLTATNPSLQRIPHCNESLIATNSEIHLTFLCLQRRFSCFQLIFHLGKDLLQTPEKDVVMGRGVKNAVVSPKSTI
nr:uncharacterized protein LOC123771983 [Procambarus clarkii]